jgi:hypothetical protein
VIRTESGSNYGTAQAQKFHRLQECQTLPAHTQKQSRTPPAVVVVEKGRSIPGQTKRQSVPKKVTGSQITPVHRDVEPGTISICLLPKSGNDDKLTLSAFFFCFPQNR